MASEATLCGWLKQLNYCCENTGGKLEKLDIIRGITARLYEKTGRDSERLLENLAKNPEGIPILLKLLEVYTDPMVFSNVFGFLRIAVTGGPRPWKSTLITMLVHCNAVPFLLVLVFPQNKNARYPESCYQDMLWTLGALALKDPRFSMKSRLHGVVRRIHLLLKQALENVRYLYPALQLTKALSRSTGTANILGKDSVMVTLEKTIVYLGFVTSARLQLALDAIAHLTKSRLICCKVVKQNLSIVLARLFGNWQHYTGRPQIRICRALLLFFSHLCAVKSGRKVIAINAVPILKEFCLNCPNDKSFDPLLNRACNVIHRCCSGKVVLPLESLESPIRVILPRTSEAKLSEDRSSADSMSISDVGSSGSETGDEEDDAGDYEEEEEDRDEAETNDAHEIKLRAWEVGNSSKRSMDDLVSYFHFLPEYGDPTLNRSLVQACINAAPANEDPNPGKCSSKKSSRGSGQPKKHDRSSSMQDDAPLVVRGVKCICHEETSQISVTSSKFTVDLTATKIDSDEIGMLKHVKSLMQEDNRKTVASAIASCTRTLIPAVKLAYPDFVGTEGSSVMAKLYEKDRRMCRSKLQSSVARPANQSMQKVVYDLDSLLNNETEAKEKQMVTNEDEARIGVKDSCGHLKFESRFESGNLRKAIQVNIYEYDLIVTPDVNSSKHLQWFYFEVSNMERGVPYVFNVVNCEKQNSQFNFGMQPVMYSVYDALTGLPRWLRCGNSICYYKNGYQTTVQSTGSTYYTTSFTITFRHECDVCYIAYHYPYTYTQLMIDIWQWHRRSPKVGVAFSADTLCHSLNGNEVPVLSFTAMEGPTPSLIGVRDRQVVVLTARVHPGESNASWVMKGFIDHLLDGNEAVERVLQKFVVKVVPMLNVEGVINGCHRCGLTNEDLNRQWQNPNPILHPEIFHTKGLLECLVRIVGRRPVIFCDFHGHSRRKNVFLYGCARQRSWLSRDQEFPQPIEEFCTLPRLMQQVCPAFSLELCNFDIEKNREATARVAMWRELGILQAYTMESTYCGCDKGLYAGYQIGTAQLEEVGACFVQAIGLMASGVGKKEGTSRESWIYEFGAHHPEREMAFKHIDELSDSDEDSDD